MWRVAGFSGDDSREDDDEEEDEEDEEDDEDDDDDEDEEDDEELSFVMMLVAYLMRTWNQQCTIYFVFVMDIHHIINIFHEVGCTPQPFGAY
jgi:ABC-type Zn2+ transport system substrate-binding protein/surface adhesin